MGELSRPMKKGVSDPNAIPGAWPTAALNVAEGRNASVKTEAIGKDLFDIVRTNRLEIDIMCTLGYDYYGLTLANLAVLDLANVSCLGNKINHAESAHPLNYFTHLVLPNICLRWAFGYEDKVCARA
jgi:hypothetical protein